MSGSLVTTTQSQVSNETKATMTTETKEIKDVTAGSILDAPAATKRRHSDVDEVDRDKKRREPLPNEKTAGKKASKPMIQSEWMIKAMQSKYRPYFNLTDDNDSGSQSSVTSNDNTGLRVVLEYPGMDESERFLLMRPVRKGGAGDSEVEDKDEYNPITDLMRTVYFIYDDYLQPEQQMLLGDDAQGIMRNLTKYRNRRHGAGFIQAVDDFNRVIRQLKDQGVMEKSAKTMRHPSYELACHILYQVYSRTVAHQADALNNYKAFSNNVYGEINPILVKDIIARTKLNSRSVFMDMGCGIGNIVLQVAAQTGCEAHGIEIMETPCKYAKRQLKEYAGRMRAWRLATGRIHFRQGDFLDLGACGMYDTLKRADVVVVNNYAFDWETNHALAQLFLDLKEGSQVVSLKSFVPKNHKINQRTFHMPESILRVQEYEYFSDGVSWTNNGGTYYIATVDRKRLQPFYNKYQQ